MNEELERYDMMMMWVAISPYAAGQMDTHL